MENKREIFEAVVNKMEEKNSQQDCSILYRAFSPKFGSLILGGWEIIYEKLLALRIYTWQSDFIS